MARYVADSAALAHKVVIQLQHQVPPENVHSAINLLTADDLMPYAPPLGDVMSSSN